MEKVGDKDSRVSIFLVIRLSQSKFVVNFTREFLEYFL